MGRLIRLNRIFVTASRSRNDLIVKMWEPFSDGSGFTERSVRISRKEGEEFIEKLAAELKKLTE